MVVDFLTVESQTNRVFVMTTEMDDVITHNYNLFADHPLFFLDVEAGNMWGVSVEKGFKNLGTNAVGSAATIHEGDLLTLKCANRPDIEGDYIFFNGSFRYLSVPLNHETYGFLYSKEVDRWMDACFSPAVKNSTEERSMRFFEESAELVHANGLSYEHAIALVNRVYSNPKGELRQEAGGVEVTFTALCNAAKIDRIEAGIDELERIWGNVEEIKKKHAKKTIRVDLT